MTVPSGATVRINGITLAGGAADPVTPEFAAGGEAVTTKFEKGEGSTWKITAFAEMSNESRGTDVTASQLKVYRASSLEGLKAAEAMTSGVTLTEKTSAVKVTLEAEAPTDAEQQFFRVDCRVHNVRAPLCFATYPRRWSFQLRRTSWRSETHPC